MNSINIDFVSVAKIIDVKTNDLYQIVRDLGGISVVLKVVLVLIVKNIV